MRHGDLRALKGVGFFVGALGLSLVGFRTSMLLLAAIILAALLMVVTLMRGELGRPDAKAKFRQMFSNNHAVNILAVWTIGYGFVQAFAPRLRGSLGGEPDGRTATRLAFALAGSPALIALALAANFDPIAAVVVGLLFFGVVFALNSAVHSYLILAYADSR